MRLIDVDKTISELKALPEQERLEYMGFYDLLKSIPTIDAKLVVHAHWEDKCVRDWHCSNCAYDIQKLRFVDGYYYNDLPEYCPGCGAKMDEETEQE